METYFKIAASDLMFLLCQANVLSSLEVYGVDQWEKYNEAVDAAEEVTMLHMRTCYEEV